MRSPFPCLNMAKKKKTRADMSKPPQYKSQPILRRTLRYVASGVQSSVAITPSAICLSLGTICTVANTTVRGFVGAVRIRRIHLWVGTSSSGTPANILVNFGSTAAPALDWEVGDETINSSELAYVTAVPPKDSLASFWNVAGSTSTLFSVTSSANCIMQLDLDFILADNDPVVTYAITSGAATLGNIYYINLSAAATAFSPVFLTTNF